MKGFEENIKRIDEQSFITETFDRGQLKIEKKVSEEKDKEGRKDFEIAIQKGVETIKLNDRLPSGWRIVEGPSGSLAGANPVEKFVQLPESVRFLDGKPPRWLALEATPTSLMAVEHRERKGKQETIEVHRFLSLRGALLVVLYEIGHSNNYDPDVALEMMKERADIQNVRAKKQFSEYSTDEMLRHNKYILEDERRAWAYAEEKLEELRKRGIDLEEGMSPQDVTAFVERTLATYTMDKTKT